MIGNVKNVGKNLNLKKLLFVLIVDMIVINKNKMVIMIRDKRIRNVKLTGEELELLIEELERQPHNIWEFFNYSKIVEKFKQALNQRGKK